MYYVYILECNDGTLYNLKNLMIIIDIIYFFGIIVDNKFIIYY